jgi:hypothetical protein
MRPITTNLTSIAAISAFIELRKLPIVVFELVFHRSQAPPVPLRSSSGHLASGKLLQNRFFDHVFPNRLPSYRLWASALPSYARLLSHFSICPA